VCRLRACRQSFRALSIDLADPTGLADFAACADL